MTCTLFVPAEKKQEEETPCSQDRSVEVVLTPDSEESSPKTPPPADQDSPGGCEPARRGAAPFKAEEPQGVREQRQHQQQEVVIKIEVSRSQELREQKHQQQQETEEGAAAEKAVVRAAASEGQQPQGQGQGAGGARSHALGYQQARRMRVARALHSMLTCGGADADDAALRPLVRRSRRSAAEAPGGGGGGVDDWPPTPTCPGMDGCGLR